MDKHQLDWISIEGFKSIANSGKIELRPINLVIGANGAGKSNFLEAFNLQKAAQNDDALKSYVKQKGGADDLLYFGSKVTSQIQIGIQLHERTPHWIGLAANITDGLNRKLLVEGLFGMNSLPFEMAQSEIERQLVKWTVYSFQDTTPFAQLKKTNKTDDNDYLRSDGSNLAAFLYRLKLRFPNAYGLIVKTVQRIAPFFEDFLLRPDNLNPEYIKLAWTHKGTDKYFGASALSDGTLRFIALATLLLQPLELRPSIILIDEPELGLHPAAITLLASMIHSASVDTQIIAATQSPILLDHFLPEDVLVAERKNGGTVFNRLNPEDYAHWLEEYSLGQLWEKNYLGGRPAPEQLSN
ncbi:MAG: AAA family ATPase [Cytophagales bacterium]|nr:AAA family ATPase [Cytophagales bacterium]